jgi:hypothetical protein
MIRRAIEQPLDMFAGPSIANMAGGTFDDLRALRRAAPPRAIDAITVPSEK